MWMEVREKKLPDIKEKMSGNYSRTKIRREKEREREGGNEDNGNRGKLGRNKEIRERKFLDM